jgi:hypothetical protein
LPARARLLLLFYFLNSVCLLFVSQPLLRLIQQVHLKEGHLVCQETGAFPPPITASCACVNFFVSLLTNTLDAADLRALHAHFDNKQHSCVDVPSGRRFRVSDGIPNMLLAQDEA